MKHRYYIRSSRNMYKGCVNASEADLGFRITEVIDDSDRHIIDARKWGSGKLAVILEIPRGNPDDIPELAPFDVVNFGRGEWGIAFDRLSEGKQFVSDYS